MANTNERLISARDAESLSLVLGERRPQADSDAASALADVLMEARLVPHEDLPADRVAMNSRVTYEELPGGARRSVVLAYPHDADAAAGSVSVLTPVGMSLLGRTPGAVVAPPMPDGRALRIRVLALERDALKEAA